MKKRLLLSGLSIVSAIAFATGDEYYNHTTFPATGSTATSAGMRAELDLVEAGFNKLPTLSGNGNKVVKINSGATAQTVSTITDDATTVTIAAEVSTSGNVTLTGAGKAIVLEGTTADDYETTLSAGEPTADRTITLPNATDTLVGKATTDTLTNKTYDTAGTGNSFSINGVAVTANTGTGAVAREAGPVFTTPTLGAASATSINKVALTAPATSATLTIADGKTLTSSNTITFTATDGSTLAIGTGGTLGTAAYTASTAYEAAGGIATHAALTATHGVSGAIVGTTDAQALTNKTLTSPVINGTVTTTGLTLPATAFNGAITGGQAATLGATSVTTGRVSTNLGVKTSDPSVFTQNTSSDFALGDGTTTAGMTIFSGTTSQGAISFADGTAASDVQYRGYINYSHNTDSLIFGAAGATKLTLAGTAATFGTGITSISGGTNPSLNIGTGALTAGATSVTTLAATGNLALGTTAVNLSGGGANSEVVTISAKALGNNALIELNGWRNTNGQVSSYLRAFNNGGATPGSEFRFIRGASDTEGYIEAYVSNALAMTLAPTALTLGAGITSISGGTNPSLNIGTGALTAGTGTFSGAVVSSSASTNITSKITSQAGGTSTFDLLETNAALYGGRFRYNGTDVQLSTLNNGTEYVALTLTRATGAVTANYGLAVTGAISATTSILSSGATSGIGYTTGAGGTVTQASSRTTGVTVNKASMAITLVSAAGSTSWQTFTVTNSAVAATDTPVCVQKSGTDLNEIHVTAVAAGSFNISFKTTGGTTTEQPVFTCNVIKGVTS